MTSVEQRRGESFVFNATNLTRMVRGPWADLFTAYRARVRIVYVEAPAVRLFAQNHSRKQRVPEDVIRRLIRRRWELPDATEAQCVDYVVEEAGSAASDR